MEIKTQKIVPVILSIVGIGGVVGTSILSVSGYKKYKELEAKEGKPKTFKQKIKMAIRAYYPAIVSGTATVGCITGSAIISKKTEVSLASSAVMADQLYNKYKNKVTSVIGQEKASEIMKMISEDDYNKVQQEDKKIDDGRKLYWEEHIGFFKATPEDIAYSIGDINKKMNSPDFYNEQCYDVGPLYSCTLDDFIKLSRAEMLEDLDKFALDYGWNIEYLDAVYTSRFVGMRQTHMVDKDGNEKYIKIEFDKDPVYMPNEVDYSEYIHPDDYQYEEFTSDNPNINKDNEEYELIPDGISIPEDK